jgi:TonB-linked SusC/RagA family outer membrane protein
MPGVTVSASKSNTTQTDADGKFRIQASENASLVFSSAGYVLQTVNLDGRRDLEVTMKSNVGELDEVVVTAFGIQRQKKSLGYVTQVIKGEELTTARETNVANSLKGKVAGVFVSAANTGPGGSTFIDIRGVSSFKGATKPLIVVDGVPIDNSTINPPDIFNSRGINRDYGDGIGNILPDDIENITVLKGPNGAALYGSRGAPGVILITTKKGQASKRIGIDFNSNATFEKPNVLPQYQEVWGGGYDDNYAMFGTATVGGQEVSVFPSWLTDHWGGKYDGRPIQLEMWPDAGLITYSPSGEDNIRKFYRTGATYTNTVGISGGNEKVNYRLSLSDLRNTGIVPLSSINRQTINLRVGFNATDKLYFEGKINYIHNKGNGRPANGLDINTVPYSLNRIPSFINLDLLRNYKSPDGASNNWADGRPFNPYWIVNEMPSHDTRDRMIGYVLGRYNFTSWLSLQARTGTDFYNDVRHSQINVGTPTSSLVRGQLLDNQITVREDNSDALLTASGNLSEDFTASVSVGANHMNRSFNSVSVEGYNMNIPGIYNIINAGLVFPTNSISREQINSVYGVGQVGYKNFLYLDITGRNDWSSTLGKNNYSFFYPSVSTSFIFTDAFKMNSNILNYGKVRLSYAQAGKGGAPYQTQIGYSLLSTGYNGQQFGRIRSDVPETNLKNELTKSVEFGTELKFFNNRIGIDFTYYSSSTENQILPVDISPATGFSSKIANAGEIRNRGIEIMLNVVPVRSKAFTWDVLVNFSRNRSQVMSLAPGIDAISLISTEEIAIEARPGLPYGNLVGYGFKRTPAGDKWLTAGGIYQHDDTLKVLGNIQPDFLGGVTNTFTYKGFTLSALIDMRVGGEIFSYSKATQTYSGTAKYTENGDNLISDGMIEGTDGKFSKSTIVVGRMNYYTSMGWGNISEAFVLPADYVALREISLGYTVGKFFKRTIFNTAKLSVVGRNLFYIYRDPQFKTLGVSPESAFSATTTAQGFEAPAAPTTRSLGFNLSFSF